MESEFRISGSSSADCPVLAICRPLRGSQGLDVYEQMYGSLHTLPRKLISVDDPL
jgi:hypothetical protein